MQHTSYFLNRNNGMIVNIKYFVPLEQYLHHKQQ